MTYVLIVWFAAGTTIPTAITEFATAAECQAAGPAIFAALEVPTDIRMPRYVCLGKTVAAAGTGAMEVKVVNETPLPVTIRQNQDK